jgi:hypothetical protein
MKVYRAQLIWKRENCQLNGVHFSQSDNRKWANSYLNKHPGGTVMYSEHNADMTAPYFGACPEFSV